MASEIEASHLLIKRAAGSDKKGRQVWKGRMIS